MPHFDFRPAQAPRDDFTVHGLRVGYRTEANITPVVSDVSFTVSPGQILGVAGESGSGKTTAVLASIGYQAGSAIRLSGSAALGDTLICDLPLSERRELWSRRISYVAQEAANSLNPAFRIGTQLIEVLEVNANLTRDEARIRARELLQAVRLAQPDAMLRRYPHQCSGGQLQRVAIAIAIACDPALIICDEPTTGLDVTTQAEVVQMLVELIRSRKMAAIYISHDLALLGTVADTLAIFYAGEIVEIGATRDVLEHPQHPYTRALLSALPSARRATTPRGLPGFPPGRVVNDSCAFAARCSAVIAQCTTEHPDLQPLTTLGTHHVRCWRTGDLSQEEPDALKIPAARPPLTAQTLPLLDIQGIHCSYGRGQSRVHAVRGVTLQIAPGDVLALVGESGSGKSTIGRAIVGLLPIDSGTITFAGTRLDPNGKRSTEQTRAIQIIFQNPDSSLNPRHTVKSLIERSFELFRPDVPRNERQAAVDAVLREVRLDPAVGSRYPHQLSGGQKQRVAIARAFAAQPKLVVCDEIVSGQDVSVQASILELVRSMQEQYGTALLFISHDLAVVRSIAQHVAVIQHGRIVESGPTELVFSSPGAPYSRRLLASVMEPETAGVSVGDPS
jgi:peptide/nickel transport system ATP-binding protein